MNKKTPNKPLIALPVGLSPLRSAARSYEVKQAYVDALLNADALPVLLPAALPPQDLPALIDKFDGFLFSGGLDLDPDLFGAEMLPSVYGVDPQRDAFELALIPLVVAADKPLLAICRGLQALNVALGGSLYVDLASELPQAQKHDYYPYFSRQKIAHNVQIEPASRLANIVGAATLATNSLHHQAARRIGAGLQVNAWAVDGVIEGLEMPERSFVLGTQWHPECLGESPASRALFAAFTSACAQT